MVSFLYFLPWILDIEILCHPYFLQVKIPEFL